MGHRQGIVGVEHQHRQHTHLLHQIGQCHRLSEIGRTASHLMIEGLGQAPGRARTPRRRQPETAPDAGVVTFVVQPDLAREIRRKEIHRRPRHVANR